MMMPYSLENRKKYYQKNKEVLCEKHRKYYQKNKEAIKESHKKYREENREAINKQRRKYREENKEAIRESNKKYHKKNPEARKEYYQKNKEALAEYSRKYKEKNKEARKESIMVIRSKKRAKRKNLSFNLTTEYIKEIWPEDNKCPALGIDLKRGIIVQDCSPSLDRIIPELGYIKGNVQIVSNLANRIMSNATPDQVIMVGEHFKKVIKELENEKTF